MKKIMYLFLLLCSSSLLKAQNDEIASIAAFQMAEERYQAGKLTEALNYLETAGKNMGNSRSKILYLKIIILDQLVKISPEYLANLEETINAFEKAGDYADFNPEKRVEVAKIKLLLNDVKNRWHEIAEMEKANIRKIDESINDFFTKMPRLGLPLAEFLEHKSVKYLKFFSTKKEIKKAETGGELSQVGGFGSSMVYDNRYVSEVKTDKNGNVKYYKFQVLLPRGSSNVDADLAASLLKLKEYKDVMIRRQITSGDRNSDYFLFRSKTSDEVPFVALHVSTSVTYYKFRYEGVKGYWRYAVAEVGFPG